MKLGQNALKEKCTKHRKIDLMVNAVDVLICWWMCEKLVGEINPRITKIETYTFAKMMSIRGEWPWTGLESHCLLSNETVTVDLSRSKSFSRKWKNLKRAADVFPVLSVQGTWIFNSHDLTQLVQFFSRLSDADDISAWTLQY